MGRCDELSLFPHLVVCVGDVPIMTPGTYSAMITSVEALKSQPGSFTIANPARIAFDLPNTVNGLGRNSQNIGEGELLSMTMVQAGERTRMVLNLTGPSRPDGISGVSFVSLRMLVRVKRFSGARD
ncbi:MAG: AMIN domain-containing protein [Anaerolineales bacterium]|nr:AMIN domain-containing protein [Anaerolineales bacterium]